MSYFLLFFTLQFSYPIIQSPAFLFSSLDDILVFRFLM